MLASCRPALFFALGALSGAFGVALGAAGAHALRPLLSETDPGGWFAIALHYQQWHALALILCGLAVGRFPRARAFAVAGLLFALGTVLFSGNLYLRTLLGFHAWHGLTPLGGLALLSGWLAFLVGAWQIRAET